MNNYSFEEIEIGYKENFTVKVDEEYIAAFRKYTGDENPLHRDIDYARKKGFEDKVVFGMLTASYYSTLVGVYLPGEKCLIHEVNTKFKAPVYAGDILTVTGEVEEKNELFQLITVKASIRNQHNKIVSKAKIVLGIMY